MWRVYRFVRDLAFLRAEAFLCLLEGRLDVTTAHAPFLHDGTWTPTPYPITVIACTWCRASKAWVPGTFYNTGHYVCGQPIPKAYDPGGSSLAAWCARNALVPVMTCANGDCGIDALLVLENSPRDAERRQALRLELCAHMVCISTDARWQEVFRNLEVWPGAAPALPPLPPPPEAPPPPLPPPPVPTPGPAPPTAAATASASDPEPLMDVDEPPVHDAYSDCIRWSTGQKDPDAGILRHLRATLTRGQLDALSEAHAARLPASTTVELKVVTSSSIMRVVAKANSAASLPQRAQDAATFRSWAKAADLDLTQRLPKGTWSRFLKQQCT